MNNSTKAVILTILIITCLTLPAIGLAQPITVTSTSPSYIDFYGKATGQCIAQVGILPNKMPGEVYFGSGNITLQGTAEAQANEEMYFANQTVNATGNLRINFDGPALQALDIDFQSSNTTSGYFVNSQLIPEYTGNFGIGDHSYYGQTSETRLVFNGTKTDQFGTSIISGTIYFCSGPESTFESDNQVILAIIYNEDGTVLASIAWAQQETVLPFRLILNAADLFQQTVNIYSVEPTVKIAANASGACAFREFITQNTSLYEDDDLQLCQGNGSISFNAMGTTETSAQSNSETDYLFRSGIQGVGSLNIRWNESQSITANIYTNSSGTGGIILTQGNVSIFIIGAIFDSQTTLLFNGTYQNATGTQNIHGTFEIYSEDIPDENGSLTCITEAVLIDENEEPIVIAIWSKDAIPVEPILTAADTFTRSINLCPAACTTAISDNNAIIADHIAATGARITIDGASLPVGTALNITTVNFGSIQPISVTSLSVNGANYFDVLVLRLDGNTFDSSVTVQIMLTNSSFNSSSAVSYWNGNSWVKAANQQFTAPNTITCSVPASALTGTPVMVDYSAPQATPTPTPTPTLTPTPTPTATPSSTPTPTINPQPSSTPTTQPTTTPTVTQAGIEQYIVAIIAAIAIAFILVALVYRTKQKNQSNP